MKEFYESLAERLSRPDFIFFNYGFAESVGDGYAWISESDRPYKYHLCLVKHVVGGIELGGKTVLEVGSGRGGNCSYLSRYTEANRIYGLDLCAGNIQFSKKVHHLENVAFLQGDAEQLPFRDEAFEVVLNLESSHCYADFEKFLSEVYRVLRPGGVFCYADLWFLEVLPYDWNQRRNALDASRFVRISEEDISEQVFKALKSADGFAPMIRAMADSGNQALVDRIIQGIEGVRSSLAVGVCSYKVWRLRK